jgi:hypothetical protein
MIYIKDQYAMIWKTEDKGNYHLVSMSTSRKDKKSGNYKSSNWAFVRFVGDAHDKVATLPEKTRILIKAGGISKESYEQDGETKWPSNPNIVVFNFELPEKNSDTGKLDTPPVVEEDSDEELPF